MAATVIVALGLTALALLAVAHAESLPDPTRPPDAVLAPADGGDATRPSGGLVLQSILIAPDRRGAVISGQSLVVGDMVGGLRLARVAAGEVTLEGLEGTRTLSLFPDVSKRSSHTAGEPAGRARRHGKH